MHKQTLLIVLGGGGHTAQMRRLVALLGDRYGYEYVAAAGDALAAHAVQGTRVYRVLNPRAKNDRNIFWITAKTIISAVQSLGVLFRSKASAIISCGPAIAVPLCVLGKLFRKKVIYLESWSRVRTHSRSAQLAKPFADLFLVQSPHLERLPQAVYAGRLG
jgi:UDP-N-acetylglucosamine:LPS N-acetylglucosamine transferase